MNVECIEQAIARCEMAIAELPNRVAFPEVMAMPCGALKRFAA
jgi:hypothetical protein